MHAGRDLVDDHVIARHEHFDPDHPHIVEGVQDAPGNQHRIRLPARGQPRRNRRGVQDAVPVDILARIKGRNPAINRSLPR